jgi:hypothetical protein
LLQSAVELGDADAIYPLGSFFEEQGELKTAHRLFDDGIKLRNVACMSHKAILLLQGKGCVKDEQHAIALLLKAADAGDIVGTAWLGKCLIDGTGIAQQKRAGAYCLQRSADAGDAWAMHELALAFGLMAIDTAERSILVLGWLTKSANAGCAAAKLSLAEHYRSDTFHKDEEKAAALTKEIEAAAGQKPPRALTTGRLFPDKQIGAFATCAVVGGGNNSPVSGSCSL